LEKIDERRRMIQIKNEIEKAKNEVSLMS